MTNNMDDLKKIYAKEFNKRVTDGKYVDTPEGETRIRILPAVKQGKHFFLKSGFHKINGEFINCPKLFANQKCPICERVSQLYNSQKPDDIELARMIKANKRYYYNAIVRGQEDKGVRVLTTGVKLFEKILGAIINSEIGDITDIKDGYDFIIRKAMKGGFWNYDASEVARKSSPLSEDPAKVEQWLASQWELTEEVSLLSFPELKQMVEQFLDGGASPAAVAAVESKVAARNNEIPLPTQKPAVVETATPTPQPAKPATPPAPAAAAKDEDLSRFKDTVSAMKAEMGL